MEILEMGRTLKRKSKNRLSWTLLRVAILSQYLLVSGIIWSIPWEPSSWHSDWFRSGSLALLNPKFSRTDQQGASSYLVIPVEATSEVWKLQGVAMGWVSHFLLVCYKRDGETPNSSWFQLPLCPAVP